MAELEVLRIVTWTVLVGTGLFLVSEYFREMRESKVRKWRRQIDASGNVLRLEEGGEGIACCNWTFGGG